MESWTELLHRKLQEARRETPQWKWVLGALDGYLAEKAPPLPPPGTTASTRLVWKIDPRFGIVRAFEQKRSPTGVWSSGRKIAWERLRRSPELQISKADREAVATLEEVFDTFRYYDPRLELDTFAALQALVGHPLVFWTDESKFPVQIEVVTPGLRLRPEKDEMVLELLMGETPVSSAGEISLVQDGRGLVAIDRAGNRVLVAAADEHLQQLAANLVRAAPRIPSKDLDGVLERLLRLETVLPVSLPRELVGELVASDPRLFLSLEPSASGELAVQLEMRPAPGGPACVPGEGAGEVCGMAEGQRVRVARRLAEEATLAQEVAAAVGLERPREAAPWRWRLPSEEETLDFVAVVNQLAEQRPDVVVEWPPGVDGLKVVGELTPGALRIEIEDRHDWFGLSGFARVGEWRIPLLDLLRRVREGRRYVAVEPGKWAAISPELYDRLTTLDDVLHPRHGELEVGATAAAVVNDLFDGEAELRGSPRWSQLAQRLEWAMALSPDPPATLTAELRDYQLEGYRWLRRLAFWGVGACLADDMGLGKTVQTLAILIDRAPIGPALIVAPTSVGWNWIREAERFAPSLRPHLYRDTDREALLTGLGSGDMVVVSYGLVLRDAKLLAAVHWGTLVLDEAQWIKNSRTKTARAVRQLQAGWRVALTGTPIENHLGELWSLFRAVSPGLLGSWERFRERFAVPIERQQDPARQQAFSRLVQPFVLRRTKAEVLPELPERTEIQLFAEMSGAERRLYEDARLSALVRLADLSRDDSQARFHVLAALTRLRQLACHPRLVDPAWSGGSTKLSLFLELVAELREGGHRALVFSQFTQHLALIRTALDEAGVAYLYLDGATPAGQRQRLVDAFQEGEGELFLISLKAGGTGLNLTAADYVIHLEPWWNPAVEDQATNRAHRIGQTRAVTVYRLVTQETIEEQILRLHAEKRDLVAGVLEGTDQAGKLSTTELVALIKAGSFQGS